MWSEALCKGPCSLIEPMSSPDSFTYVSLTWQQLGHRRPMARRAGSRFLQRMCFEVCPGCRGEPESANAFSARRFYEEAFGWQFRDSTTTKDGRQEDPTAIVHFSLGATSPGGGITKVNPEDFLRTQGKGGPIIHLMVSDLEASMKVRNTPWCTLLTVHRSLTGLHLKKVLAAGGKKMTEVEPEGTRALMQCYEDSEGNYGGLYMLKKEWR